MQTPAQNTFKLPNGWAFALPQLPPAESLASDDVARAAATVVPAAELVAFNQRFDPFQARGAFADHDGTLSALGILRARASTLVDAVPKLASTADRHELALPDLWRSRDLNDTELAELVELGRASRSDKSVRAAVLESLTRRDPNAHERRLQIVFLRSALAVVFGPEGIKSRAAFFQRLHAPKAVEQLDENAKGTMRQQTARHRTYPGSFHRVEIGDSQRAEFLALAAAAREDKNVLDETLAMLTRPDPTGQELRLQAVFIRTNPAILGAEGVRAHASVIQRLERETLAELQACVQLQAEIVRAADAGQSSVRHFVTPAQWPGPVRDWFTAAGGDLKRLEAQATSAIAEARANQPCLQCRGDRMWRNRNSGGWETCGECWGTGSADKATIEQAKQYGVKAPAS